MTREVARREIESLDYYLQNHTDDYSEESHTAMMMAISALSKNKCFDGMTNGEVIQTLFPNVSKYTNMLLENHSRNILFNDDWWNAPYQKGGE